MCRAGRWPLRSRAIPANGSRPSSPTPARWPKTRPKQVEIDYEALPFVLDAEEALQADSPLVHEAHGSNVLLDKTFVWGEVEKDFAASPRNLTLRVKWGRSSTVPIETFGVVASWDPWRDIARRLCLDPDAALRRPDRRGAEDSDLVGARALRRRRRRQLRRQARHQAHGAVRLSGAAAWFPVRLIEDRLENMRGGDAHGPERLFDVEVAFDDNGIVRSMKMRALENVGAYAGRSPFQLGKPIGAIVGPYKIKSVQYRAIAVVTNKTTQEAVRGFGQAPTNLALERCMDEVANCPRASIRWKSAGAT